MLTITAANFPKTGLQGSARKGARAGTLPPTLSHHVSDDALIEEIARGNRRAMDVIYALCVIAWKLSGRDPSRRHSRQHIIEVVRGEVDSIR